MTPGDRPGSEPELSVVIAATDSPSAAARTLGSLRGPGSESGRVELIVAAPWASAAGGDARHIQGPPGSGVPGLRGLGVRAARGRVVAFTEDSCVAGPGWAEAWVSAFADGTLAAGTGPVEHDAAASTLDWAVVFCEYAPFLADRAAGRPDRLAGNNFAATREAAESASIGGEVHEVALLALVGRAGGTARSIPGAGVRHVRRFGPREAFGDRLRFGLEFGRLRRASASRAARWLGLVAGPAIFGAQVARVGRAALATPHRARFVASLPIVLALLGAWSLGEWLGWAFGLGSGQCERADRPSGGDRPVLGSGRGAGLRRGP